MSPKYITQKEFEQRTGKGRGWQWKARKEGLLGYYQINTRILYSEKHLEDCLKGFEVLSSRQASTAEELNATRLDHEKGGNSHDK